MNGESMRRQADTPRRDSPLDTQNSEEQQPLTHSDDSTAGHHNATDSIAALHSQHRDTQRTYILLVRRPCYVVPAVAFLSTVLVLLVIFAYLHFTRTNDEAIASSHFPAVCLASWEGQWGNIVYQLMFLLSYARRHNLTAYVRPAKPKGSSPLWHGYRITYADQLYGLQPCPWKQASNVLQIEYGKREEWADSMTVPPLEQREGGATLTAHETSAPEADNVISSDGTARLVVLHRGYYQFHTSGYRPYRDWLTRHMQPKADVEAVLLSLWYQLLLQMPADMLLIGVHVRHGDYTDTVGSEFRRIPLHWYFPWIDAWQHNDAHYLELTDTTPHEEMTRALQRQRVEQSRARAWLHIDELVLPLFAPSLRPFCRSTNLSSSAGPTLPTSPSFCVLIVSDDVQVADTFNERGYATVTAQQLLSFQSNNIALSDELGSWYVDWWLLTRVGVLATSHSSFSHTASLYNVWGDEGSYWRPDAMAMRLTQYEPWNSQYVHHLFKNVVFD